jgi:hypothetical protein
VHFPHLSVEDNNSAVSQEAVEAPDEPQRILRQEDSLQTLTRDITDLSQRLVSQTDQSVPSPAILEAVRSAKFSLTAAIASAQGTSAIPDKEVIAPNQKSWTETAVRMGVKKAPKRKRLPEESGLTKRSIGVAKGKKVRIYNDPYAGGERSGKRAKPDALSAAANVRARDSGDPSAGATLAPPPTSQPLPTTVPTFALTQMSTFALAPASQPLPTAANARSRKRAPRSIVGSSFVHAPTEFQHGN